MSRIVVSGYYGSKNAGDEAMLSAMLEVLSDLDPKLHITVISADPEDTRKRHGVDAISWLGFPAIIKELRQADLLISGGGSLLQNVTSRRSLYYYMFIIMLAHFLGTKVMLYAQGIGPIIGRVAEMAMRFLGNHVDLITVRDEGSLKELARLGIHKTIIECTADPVLAIHPVGKEAGRASSRPTMRMGPSLYWAFPCGNGRAGAIIRKCWRKFPIWWCGNWAQGWYSSPCSSRMM